jgi:TatD DNase family protein
MLIDSHCHLNYLDDPEEAIGRAREAGVTTCLCISVDEAGFSAVKSLATRHADIWATAGVHPDAAEGNLEWIEAELTHERVVAVGETGLDYLHADDASAQARQREAFALQLDLGIRHDMPVVVHTRQAEKDTLDLLQAHRGVKGVLHRVLVDGKGSPRSRVLCVHFGHRDV